MASPFQSARLTYRAVETPEDNDFFVTLQTDPIGYAQSNWSISVPQSKKSATEFQKYVSEDTMLGVLCCIPSPTPDTAPPIPIACMHLDRLKENHAQHRNATLAIDVLPQYQGQGYGSEAIKWALKWAFVTRGLHRVGIDVFEYNDGAYRLYKKLGFKDEGRRRDFVYFQGRWYDDIKLGMLEDEWRELYGQDEA